MTDPKAKKQAGKKQGITNTFIRIHTRPEDYQADPNCAGYDVSHCELCGNKIDYHFKLTHPRDLDFKKGKSLKVGSDCIIRFAEIYMPTKMDQFLKRVKETCSEAKSRKFKAENPTVFEDAKQLEDLLKTLDRQYPWNPTKRFEKVKSFYKDKRHLIRHQYLSKPKIKAMISLKKEVNTWSPLLELWMQRTKLNKGLSWEEGKLQNPEFYESLSVYGKALGFSTDSKIAYTALEIELYWNLLEDLKEENKKRKKYFQESLEKFGKLYERVYNQGPEGSYWPQLVSFRPLSYYQLKALMASGETFDEKMSNFKGQIALKRKEAKEIIHQLPVELFE